MKHKYTLTVQARRGYGKFIDAKQLRAAAELTLSHQQAPTGAALTLVITGDEQIHALNKQYRDVDAPTDVLAFAALEAVEQARLVNAPDEPLYLGDVVISYPRAEAQAQAGGHPPHAELQLLVIHGVLHLLGHDHATSSQKRAMWKAQAEILRLAGISIAAPA